MSILGDLGLLLKFSLSSFVVPGSAPSKSNSARTSISFCFILIFEKTGITRYTCGMWYNHTTSTISYFLLPELDFPSEILAKVEEVTSLKKRKKKSRLEDS